jgi:hypothetical protein
MPTQTLLQRARNSWPVAGIRELDAYLEEHSLLRVRPLDQLLEMPAADRRPGRRADADRRRQETT